MWLLVCLSECICNYASWVLETAIEIETADQTSGNKFKREEKKERHWKKLGDKYTKKRPKASKEASKIN